MLHTSNFSLWHIFSNFKHPEIRHFLKKTQMYRNKIATSKRILTHVYGLVIGLFSSRLSQYLMWQKNLVVATYIVDLLHSYTICSKFHFLIWFVRWINLLMAFETKGNEFFHLIYWLDFKIKQSARLARFFAQFRPISKYWKVG